MSHVRSVSRKRTTTAVSLAVMGLMSVSAVEGASGREQTIAAAGPRQSADNTERPTAPSPGPSIDPGSGGAPKPRLRSSRQNREDISARRVNDLGAAIWTPRGKSGAIDIFDHAVRLSLLGYLKLDVLHDFGALGLSEGEGVIGSFVTGAIPPEGTEASRRTGRTGFTANHTRFSVNVSTPSPIGEWAVFAQVQFNNYESGPPDPYLRQAYLEIGPVLAGRSWSTFTPTAPIPFTLDYEGPNAIPELRQALVRWTQPLPKA